MKYSKSDALLIWYKRGLYICMRREGLQYYTSESQSEIDSQPVSFQDKFFVKISTIRSHQEEIFSLDDL